MVRSENRNIAMSERSPLDGVFSTVKKLACARPVRQACSVMEASVMRLMICLVLISAAPAAAHAQEAMSQEINPQEDPGPFPVATREEAVALAAKACPPLLGPTCPEEWAERYWRFLREIWAMDVTEDASRWRIKQLITEETKNGGVKWPEVLNRFRGWMVATGRAPKPYYGSNRGSNNGFSSSHTCQLSTSTTGSMESGNSVVTSTLNCW